MFKCNIATFPRHAWIADGIFLELGELANFSIQVHHAKIGRALGVVFEFAGIIIQLGKRWGGFLSGDEQDVFTVRHKLRK